MMKRYDAIIIGAGPAGCATALFLKQAGFDPLLMDRARFPRDKVCGEFISPAADSLLRQMGVLDAIEETLPHRLRGVALSAYGDPEIKFSYPNTADSKGPVTSLSLRRYEFDRILVDNVRQQGIEIREEHQVQDFLMNDGIVTGIRGMDANQIAFELKARVVVDAGGRNAVSLRRFDLRRKSNRRKRIALAAHWDAPDFPSDYCYMHVSSPGYTGMASVAGGGCNVVLVVPPGAVQGKDRENQYRQLVLKNARRANLLQGATPAEPVRVVDSLAFDVQPPSVGGLLLVGDAMGFLDPFTGEGIYLSLRSAQVAAEVLSTALHSGDCSREGLRCYEERRFKEFSGKFQLSRMLQALIYSPGWCRRVVKTLSRRRDLADPLIGVIGDYYSPRAVMRAGYGLRLLAAVLTPGRDDSEIKKGPQGSRLANPVGPE